MIGKLIVGFPLVAIIAFLLVAPTQEDQYHIINTLNYENMSEGFQEKIVNGSDVEQVIYRSADYTLFLIVKVTHIVGKFVIDKQFHLSSPLVLLLLTMYLFSGFIWGLFKIIVAMTIIIKEFIRSRRERKFRRRTIIRKRKESYRGEDD